MGIGALAATFAEDCPLVMSVLVATDDAVGFDAVESPLWLCRPKDILLLVPGFVDVAAAFAVDVDTLPGINGPPYGVKLGSAEIKDVVVVCPSVVLVVWLLGRFRR